MERLRSREELGMEAPRGDRERQGMERPRGERLENVNGVQEGRGLKWRC